MEKLLVKTVEEFGMELKVYKWKSFLATIAEGENTMGKWATLYRIESLEQGKGHASEMLKMLKLIYANRRFGGTVALNDTMRHLYEKFGITEYKDE